MIEGWKKVRLGDVGTVITGKTPKTNNEFNFGFDYLFITPRDFNGEKYITKTERMVSTSGLSSIKSSELQECSICITCIGSDMGEVAMIKTKAVTNQQINSISNIDIKLFYPDYVYYALKGYKKYFKRITGGSALPILNKNYFSDVKISLPPLPEQKSIAAILSSLDNKIENLRQQNQTLEKIAQTLFKHWFVDFEFPNKQGKPYKSSSGKMIDSELGSIPVGWRVVKESNEINIAYGKNLPTKNLLNEGYTVFGANGLIGYFDSYHYEYPQVLISCRGEASGKVNFSLPFSFVTNNSLVLEIKLESQLSFVYLKYYCLNHNFLPYVTGTAQPQITIESLRNFLILIPRKCILILFSRFVESIEKRMSFNNTQIQTLTKTRDTLLPKLMSGEIRV